MERTFILVKPDGVKRGLVGNIVSRFESKGFHLAQAKLISIDQSLAETHYAEHAARPFFGDLVSFITSGPSFAMVWEGDGAVKNARSLIGKTNPADAEPGTIRGDFALSVESNIVHGSDSPENADREIGLFFH
ncbi:MULTISPECIES: nucleoside-diphosphate kinase [Paenibacillus]|uniref:Nucleoside diphosphate kinase n=1 Tax=Paenibacillus radicis (ex Gao et al. 2016) TaxID=1737354 RepID=A0A917HE43_9BACL|nr:MULTISPECIES: nucleoside-diphosphate kinase [Paenibacillus]GGG76366.1 nucleoside diphosphate kinase [Paenibacillus radicis (ex Gao et al. 2016)]